MMKTVFSIYVQLPFICRHHSTIGLLRKVSSSSGPTGMRQSICWTLLLHVPNSGALTLFRYDHLGWHKHFQLLINFQAEIMDLKCFFLKSCFKFLCSGEVKERKEIWKWIRSEFCPTRRMGSGRTNTISKVSGSLKTLYTLLEKRKKLFTKIRKCIASFIIAENISHDHRLLLFAASSPKSCLMLHNPWKAVSSLRAIAVVLCAMECLFCAPQSPICIYARSHLWVLSPSWLL